MTSSLAFRNDIHALRALAVVVVVLFHFDVAGFTGGFSGVDVFFVISGFLMTGIILSGSEKGNFSIWRFYWARVRRIMPALTVLCACLLAFGWFWVGPSEYERLGMHIFSSLGIASNFIYMDESGYFDAPSQQKWLLHTWALSVEWQFYLLYPLFILLIAKLSKGSGRAISTALLVLAGVSLLGSVLVSPVKPNFSFFMLPLRIWEMVGGGLIYVYAANAEKRLPAWCAWAGLVCVIAASALFSSGMIWPGFAALLPVAGAMLFIAAAPRHRIILHPIVQRIGDWSYSIYLWHWPVYVLLAYFGIRFPGWQIGGIAISILLGAASYYLVEQPARRYPLATRPVLVTLMLIAAVMALSLSVNKQRGIPARMSEAVLLADKEGYNRLPEELVTCGTGIDPSQPERRLCIVGADGSAPSAIVWGDSHAGSVTGALYAHRQQPIAFFINQCPVIFDTRLKGKNQKADCPGFHAGLRAYLAEAPGDVPLIIGSRFSAQIHGPNEMLNEIFGVVYEQPRPEEAGLTDHALYQERLVESLCEVSSARKTYVVRPIPEMGEHIPRTVVRQLITGQEPAFTLPMQEYQARHAVVNAALEQAQQECGVILLDTPAYLCPDGQQCMGVLDGRPLYRDDDHLSEHGNRLLIPMFAGAGL